MRRWEKYKEYLIWGDWHTHTIYTDGQNTVFEMCEQAVKNNLKLIAFTEHVRRSLDYDFDRFLGDIESARRAYPNLIILAGCEAKVLDTEGNLDVSPEIIKKCDIVVASFHGFPYGEKITVKKLKMVDKAEGFLFKLGFNEFRVRIHEIKDKYMARIELNPDELKNFKPEIYKKVTNRFKKLGFTFVVLDLEGYKRGKINMI